MAILCSIKNAYSSSGKKKKKMTFSILDFYPHNYLCPMLYLAYSILPLDEQNRSYSRERRGLDLNRWLCVLPNSRATMATSKGGCCLATGNINEEISKLYLEKKKKKHALEELQELA